MKSTVLLSDIQKEFRAGLSEYYPDHEIRQIFYLATEHLLNYSKIDIFLKANEPISKGTCEKFRHILQRLQKWEPVQYVTGLTWFYGLSFHIDRRVLVPRPETEELVHWIIQHEKESEGNWLDIGTGSGCIAVSLAVNVPGAKVSASDISRDALKVARGNALHNNAEVNFFESDLLSDAVVLPGKYRVIVSNPPYVRESDRIYMRPNVLDYEPGIALFVPDHDPLLFYRRIALLARKYLIDGGTLYFEINENYAHETVKLLKNTGLYAIEVKQDINGKDRMIKARK